MDFSPFGLGAKAVGLIIQYIKRNFTACADILNYWLLLPGCCYDFTSNKYFCCVSVSVAVHNLKLRYLLHSNTSRESKIHTIRPPSHFTVCISLTTCSHRTYKSIKMRNILYPFPQATRLNQNKSQQWAKTLRLIKQRYFIYSHRLSFRLPLMFGTCV